MNLLATPRIIDTNIKSREEAIAQYEAHGYSVYPIPPHILPEPLQAFSWDFAALRSDRIIDGVHFPARNVVVILGTAETRSKINLRLRLKVCTACDYEMDYFNLPE